MRKMMLALVGLFMMSAVVFAHEGENKKCGNCCKNKGDFAKNRTEKMAERYGLNEDQKAKVLKLNTEFFGNLAKEKGECNKSEAKKCCDAKKDTTKKGADKTKQCNKKDGNGCCKDKAKAGKQDLKNCDNKCDSNVNSAEKEAKMAKLKEQVANYKAELKKIFTEEQYTQFEKDVKERAAKCGGSCKK